MTGERVLYGVAASPGIGIGHALVYKEKPMGSLEREIADPKLELERYHSAVETFCHVTQVKADRVAEMAGKERGDIIRCQADMIRDPYLNGQVEGRIASGQSAEAALSASCDLFIDLFTAAENEVTRQRAADVRDLRGRDAPPAAGPAGDGLLRPAAGHRAAGRGAFPLGGVGAQLRQCGGHCAGQGRAHLPQRHFGPGPGNPRRAGPGGPGAGTPPPARPSLWTATGAAWCSPPAR